MKFCNENKNNKLINISKILYISLFFKKKKNKILIIEIKMTYDSLTFLRL